MNVRIDHAVSHGTFSLDGQTFDVDNNIWVVGNDTECVVIDAPHDVNDIVAVVGHRTVVSILLTHAHDDHCRVVLDLRDRVSAPIHLHADDRPLWELTHGKEAWNRHLFDGQVLRLAGLNIHVLHTPGHSPGAVCFYLPELGCVFTGDTLFKGGPGATGRSFSDRATLEDSIRRELFVLPDETIVHTGHGDDTTIGVERSNLPEAQTRRLPGEEAPV